MLYYAVILVGLVNLVTGDGVRCQEITIPMCKTIQYNYTNMPNSFNHETQEEAGMEVHAWWPLVQIQCSDDLQFFICSLYVPICMDDYAGTVPPCRTVCERARAGCEPVMKQYNFQWPEHMACDKFPRFGKHSICMDEKGGEPPSSTHTPNPPILAHIPVVPLPPPLKPPLRECTECVCTPPLIRIKETNVISSVNTTITTGNTKNCAFPCRAYGYDSQEQIAFANYWITFWSTVTCSLCSVTVLTFMIDSNRFNYPERPIIWISVCYVFVSIGYIIRVYFGHESIACGGSNSPIVKYAGAIITPYQSSDPLCTIVFLLTYYFSLSGAGFYVVLTISWYLASVLKWSTEAISEKSSLFHTVVWVTSALVSLSILLTDKIDGDSISGICYVGNNDHDNLMYFVIGPFGALLLIGSLFLVSGFIALLRIRTVIAREVRNFHKLEKLMIRVGVFGFLYTVNAVSVLGVHFWEANERNNYVTGVNCNTCGGGSLGVHNAGIREIDKPAYSVLMIKYFMSLATGITSSIWVFSSKTIVTWRSFICNRVFFFCVPSCSSGASDGNSRSSILTHGNNTLSKQTHV